MEHTVIEKTAKTGQKIEIRIKEYLPGTHIAQLFLDGQYIFGLSEPTALASPRGEITHWMGKEGKAVGLTAAEAATIKDAIDAADAAWRASQDGQAAALRIERARLVTQIAGLHDDAQAAFDHLWDREEESGAFAAKEAILAGLPAAEAALAEFDAIYPEVKAALLEEKRSAAARFAAAD